MQECGSVLLGSTAAARQALTARHSLLAAAGIQAQQLDHTELQAVEPALECRPNLAGLIVPSDAQLVRALCPQRAAIAACKPEQ